MSTSAKNKNLSVLSNAEQSAFYDIPEYNNEQRLEYLNLTEVELQVALNRRSFSAQVYCILQIGYFKAVKSFFRIDLEQADPEDISFILQQYFNNTHLETQIISKHEHYAVCKEIASLFGYMPWTKTYEADLYAYAKDLIRRDMNQHSIAISILDYLQQHKIIRPKYTTLQAIVSIIVKNERVRLIKIIRRALTNEDIDLLKSLIAEDSTLSKLAALKQDAKDFKSQMIIAERHKLEILRPIYKIAKQMMPQLQLSQQNIHHYASLANYHTIHDLREMLTPELTYLYLICYSWKRFRQISDNLVSAFSFFMKQIESEIETLSDSKLTEYVMNQRDELTTMRSIAKLYVDEKIPDDVSFGVVRNQVFAIVSRDKLCSIISTNTDKDSIDNTFYWQAVDSFKRKIALNLRQLVNSLEFSSTNDNQWLAALNWMKSDFWQRQITPLASEAPDKSIPPRLLAYLTDNPEKSFEATINQSRFEFWVYQQIKRHLSNGSIFLIDSLQYGSLQQELIPIEKMQEQIHQLNLTALTEPFSTQLDALVTELDQLWHNFNKELKRGTLKHLRYDDKDKTLHWHKLKTTKDEHAQTQFYKQLSLCDITDVLRWSNNRCGLFSAFTHIQPRYSKQSAKDDCLIGTIIAQAMNNGNLNMADISDIPYTLLQDTLQSRVRESTLIAANNLISNDTAKMSIFPYYSFDLDLYGAVDGQKFEAETPTIKTRYSKKYFRKGKGIVAYTLLSNHIPLQSYLIGANEHESYFAFDIWYNNASEISPNVLTGDMHIMNPANFAIMHWFNGKLYPRFTNVDAQRIHLYSGSSKPEYAKYLVQPYGAINRRLIESEELNLKRVIATLAANELTQSAIIKKLCTHKHERRTQEALFEFDKLVRSIYTLKYLLDPTIHKNTHRSQNRLEQYHQLRSAIAQAYGKKQLIGRTDIALEISNHCGRLVANAIIQYNSAILSKLLDKYEVEGNKKALKLLKSISPVAWQHIHFQGHFIFSEEHIIDLDEIIKKLTVG